MFNQRSGKRFLLNPKFQINFILTTVFFNILLSLSFFLAARSSFSSFKSQGRSAGIPETHVFFQFITKQENAFYINMGISFIIITIIACIYGVMKSHKIAGPMYRLHVEFDRMKKNKALHKFNFRKKDFFQEIPEAFNDALDDLEK